MPFAAFKARVEAFSFTWDSTRHGGSWKNRRAGQRHIVLFADAADAEEPGAYRELIAKMTAQGATVSVIALGTPQDRDAGLLEEIGALGGGRVFFNADPSELPGLFTQETVALARSAFLTEPVPVIDAGGWPEIAAKAARVSFFGGRLQP